MQPTDMRTALHVRRRDEADKAQGQGHFCDQRREEAPPAATEEVKETPAPTPAAATEEVKETDAPKEEPAAPTAEEGEETATTTTRRRKRKSA